MLPDVNVWLALTFDSHVHHPSAKVWFDALPNGAVCYFCRLTQMGFLRLASNQRAFGVDALTLPDAWQKFDTFLSDPRVEIAAEPPDLEVHWRMHTKAQTFSPKVWNDAYLAAFALAANLEMITFDKAFGQYTNLRCTVLN